MDHPLGLLSGIPWKDWLYNVASFIFKALVIAVVLASVKVWLELARNHTPKRVIVGGKSIPCSGVLVAILTPWNVVYSACALLFEWWAPAVPKMAEGVTWYAIDLYRSIRNPTPRRLYGVWMYVGMYGKGKTVSMTARLYNLRRVYGDKIRIYTNYGFKLEDGPINGWRHMVEARLSEKNTVFAFDEIGNTFTQKQSGSKKEDALPEDLIPLLTQCRKWGPGVQVLCTVQRFTMTEVTWRRMAQYIIECRSYLGARVIWQRAYEGLENYQDGVDPNPPAPKRVVAWSQWFLVSDYVRSLYDTFFIARRMRENGEAELPGWDEIDRKTRDDASATLALMDGMRVARNGTQAVGAGRTR